MSTIDEDNELLKKQGLMVKRGASRSYGRPIYGALFHDRVDEFPEYIDIVTDLDDCWPVHVPCGLPAETLVIMWRVARWWFERGRGNGKSEVQDAICNALGITREAQPPSVLSHGIGFLPG